MPTDSKQEYLRHAEICLKLARSIPNREERSLLREMAAAWLKLVETEPRPQVDGIGLSPNS